MTDELKERIKLETEVLRFFVLIGVAVGTGTLSVLIGGLQGLRLYLVILGLPMTMGVGALSWLQSLKIRDMIRTGGHDDSS
jgi:hypothetical protein